MRKYAKFLHEPDRCNYEKKLCQKHPRSMYIYIYIYQLGIAKNELLVKYGE